MKLDYQREAVCLLCQHEALMLLSYCSSSRLK